MNHVAHIEVLLAGGYALFLVGVATTLEFLAHHSHHRSEHFRNSGFVYKHKLDVWECPTGQQLKREKMDFESKIAHYRAPAHKCNACHCKKDCTDSENGRLLESRLDAWLQSGLSRFHRGISLALLLLAVIILASEMLRYRERNDWAVLVVLLLSIGFVGFRNFISFIEPTTKIKSAAKTIFTM